MKRKNLLWMFFVGVALVGVTVFQVINASTRAPAERAGSESRLEAGHVAAEGRVTAYPGAEVIVSAERVGRLVKLQVEEGRRVAKGELLAELDSDELQAGLAEARARIAEAEAEVRLGEITLKRREDLVRQEVIARHDRDQSERDLDVSRARLETARAEAARYEVLIEKTRIVSPIAGTVVARHVDAGETVEVGDPVVTVANLKRLRVEAEADESDAGAVAVGRPVLITADGFPDRVWKGRVEEIADAVTPRKLKPQDPSRPSDTRTLTVKVALEEKTPLKLGATVEIKIDTAAAREP